MPQSQGRDRLAGAGNGPFCRWGAPPNVRGVWVGEWVLASGASLDTFQAPDLDGARPSRNPKLVRFRILVWRVPHSTGQTKSTATSGSRCSLDQFAVKVKRTSQTTGSVWLAVAVVPWHTFNLVGFGPVNLQARHTKYQGSCREPETLGLDCCRIDLPSKALTFAENCHYRSLSKVRDEKSHVYCGAAQEARSPIERNCRKSSAVEGLPQAGA